MLKRTVSYLQEFFERFGEHQLIAMAAQCAYYLLLSLFPFILFIISLLSFSPFAFEDALQLIDEAYVPQEIMNFVENEIEGLKENQNTGILSLGILFSVWTASLSINAILRSLNWAYNVTEKRNPIIARLISIGLTIGVFLVVLVALVLQVIGGHLIEFFNLQRLPIDPDLLRWVISSIFIFLVFMILYIVGPSTKLSIRETYIGAIFATLGWQLTSFLFSIYLSNFADYTATYGTLGIVIALMIWFHLSSIVILIGGELNAMRSMKENSYRLPSFLR